MMIRGSLLPSIPIVKAFSSQFLVQNLAGSRDLWVGGRRWPHIWVSWPRFAYSLYNFHGATMTIKGSLLPSISIVKAFFMQNFLSPIENWPKICVLGGNTVEMWNFVFGTPKRHILARNDVIWRIDRENRCRELLCTASPEPPKN